MPRWGNASDAAKGAAERRPTRRCGELGPELESAMYPELFRIGFVSIHSYGAALALALFLTVGLARHVTRRSLHGLVPMDETALVDWAMWTMLGGIVGGRLLYVLLNWDVYAARPWEIPALWHGGLVWYGGFAGGVAATWLYLKRRGHALWRGLDQIIPFVALGHAVGRIGCFANGCCYGIPTSAWFGVQLPGFPSPVVPTQLIESMSLVVLYVMLRRFQIPPILRRPGALFSLYLVGYGLIRWTVEFWRADQPIVWAGLTLHQLISVVLVVAGVWLSVRQKRGERPVTSHSSLITRH